MSSNAVRMSTEAPNIFTNLVISGVNLQMKRSDAPALTPEAREQQLIAKAERLAEQKLEDGTASPQIIVHYLRLGSQRAALEQELLKSKNELQQAQVEAIRSQANLETMFKDAVRMFTTYSGQDEDV